MNNLRIPRCWQLYLTCVFCLLLISCAGLDERLQARIDSNQGRVAPRYDSPETTGLLIINVSLQHKGSLSFGLTQTIDVDGATIRRSGTYETMYERQKKQLVFFQLLPGKYELVSVRGDFGAAGSAQHRLEPFLVPEVGPIEVAAGQVVYVGKLKVAARSKLGQLDFIYTFEWDRNPARKAEALLVFEQQYADSPWVSILRGKQDINDNQLP